MSPPSTLRFATIRALCAALPLAGLSACGSLAVSDFPPVCPAVGVPRDAADLTQFRGTGTDLTDMVADGRIIGLSGKCALDDPTHLRTKVSVTLDLTRGPASTGHALAATYFVSVAKGQTILDKHDYPITAEFPGNADKLRLTGEEIDLVLPINDKVTGESYSVFVGFQLTPQELEFNRRRGVR